MSDLIRAGIENYIVKCFWALYSGKGQDVYDEIRQVVSWLRHNALYYHFESEWSEFSAQILDKEIIFGYDEGYGLVTRRMPLDLYE